MEIKWSKIKDWIYLATIALAVLYHFYDEGQEKATTDVTIVVHTEDIAEIKQILKDHGGYWLEQKEINGAIVTALGIDVE